MTKDITFASFNLYNLELPGRIWRYTNAYSPVQYEAKTAWTARMLQRLGADVIAFQELWSPQCLVDAFAAAGLRDAYELVTIKDTLDEDWYDIAVAAAVRKPWQVRRKRLRKAFPEGYRLIKRGRGSGDATGGAAIKDPQDDEIEVTIRQVRPHDHRSGTGPDRYRSAAGPGAVRAPEIEAGHPTRRRRKGRSADPAECTGSGRGDFHPAPHRRGGGVAHRRHRHHQGERQHRAGADRRSQ